MSAFELKRFEPSSKKLSYLQRSGETRVGAVLQDSKLNTAKYVLIGIEENIDVLVFCGRTKSTAFSLCSSVHVSGKNKSGLKDSKLFKNLLLSLFSILPI